MEFPREAYGATKRLASVQGRSPKTNYADVALTERHKQEAKAVVNPRVKALNHRSRNPLCGRLVCAAGGRTLRFQRVRTRI